MKIPKNILKPRMTKYGNKISLGDFPEEKGYVSLVHENDVDMTKLSFLAPKGMKLTMAGTEPVNDDFLPPELRSPYEQDECLIYIGHDVMIDINRKMGRDLMIDNNRKMGIDINRKMGEDGEFLIIWKTRNGLPLSILLHHNSRGKSIIIFEGKEYSDVKIETIICQIHFKPKTIIPSEYGKEFLCIHKLYMPGFYREV